MNLFGGSKTYILESFQVLAEGKDILQLVIDVSKEHTVVDKVQFVVKRKTSLSTPEVVTADENQPTSPYISLYLNGVGCLHIYASKIHPNRFETLKLIIRNLKYYNLQVNISGDKRTMSNFNQSFCVVNKLAIGVAADQRTSSFIFVYPGELSEKLPTTEQDS